MRVVITGGTGFIGRKVVERLVAKAHEPVVFTRDATRSRDFIHPKAEVVSWAEGAPLWETRLCESQAVVNLAGESIAQRWTKKAKEKIVSSRLFAAERLHGALEKSETKPAVLVNASAVGYYGPHGDEELTEESAPGGDFLATTCVKWEEAARRFEALGIRVVRARSGVVLGEDGGALPKMLPAFKLGQGAPLGSGQQWMSWIHRDDLADLVVFALENERVSGALNATAPVPVRNEEFTRALNAALPASFARRIAHAPLELACRVNPKLARVPAGLLKLALGEMSTALLDGQRALPKRPLALGFTFRHTEIHAALRDLVG